MTRYTTINYSSFCCGIDETQKSEETVANSPSQDTHSETSSFLEVGLRNEAKRFGLPRAMQGIKEVNRTG